MSLKKPAYRPITESELSKLVEQGWNEAEEGTALHKQFRFKGFSPAWSFMNQIATRIIEDKLPHHPEWTNAYSK